MNTWLTYSLLTILFWGLYALFPKLSSQHLSTDSIFIWQAGISVMLIPIYLLVRGIPAIEYNVKGVLFCGATVFFGLLGTWAYTNAASVGAISKVVGVTSLYPALTVLLSCFILGEALTLKQGIGFVLSFIAIYLISAK